MQYVATLPLPCEIWKSKNVTYFGSIHNKLLACSCESLSSWFNI